jgi:DNA polymerase-1
MLNNIKDPQKLVLIDGNALMYRAYYGVNKNFIPTLKGMPVGMVYGFSSILLNIIEFLEPEFIAITFDTKEKTFRHKMDANYKAHRKAAPDDFYPQMPYVKEMAESFSIPIFELPGYEADDLIGSFANFAGNKGVNVVIVSGDMDFTQLLSDKIKLLKLNGKIDQSPIYGPDEVFSRYGVLVEQMIDFKAITGDSSDNYSGLPGVGPKTAQKLLEKYNSIKGIIENINFVEPLKLREKILDNYDYLMHCQKLAAIKIDINVNLSFDQEFKLNEERIDEFFSKMQFRALQGRLQRLINKSGHVLKIEQKNSSGKVATESQMSLF